MHEITIPLEIPSQNSLYKGLNPKVIHARIRLIREAWRWHAWAEMLRHGIKGATGSRKLLIFAHRKRKCSDIANLIGGAKPCIDGLKDAGLIVDDSDKFMRAEYHQYTVSRGEKPKTVIEVYDL